VDIVARMSRLCNRDPAKKRNPAEQCPPGKACFIRARRRRYRAGNTGPFRRSAGRGCRAR
jgi:hypothetical protein